MTPRPKKQETGTATGMPDWRLEKKVKPGKIPLPFKPLFRDGFSGFMKAVTLNGWRLSRVLRISGQTAYAFLCVGKRSLRSEYVGSCCASVFSVQEGQVLQRRTRNGTWPAFPLLLSCQSSTPPYELSMCFITHSALCAFHVRFRAFLWIRACRIVFFLLPAQTPV